VPNERQGKESEQDAFWYRRNDVSGNGTSLKLDMYEYKEMNLSVVDKVYLDLTKDENTGI